MRSRDGTRHSIRERNGEETREGVNGHGSVGAHRRDSGRGGSLMCLGRNLRVAEGARYGEAGQNGAVGVVRRSFRHHRRTVCQNNPRRYGCGRHETCGYGCASRGTVRLPMW